ncbi:helix-turn-helix transcriptional regulator [Micromonospora sp. NPDC050980]|uniref:helix-turn-helix transcriptional regulator n=1 Tax=Micromonospora sp. NPDC050980 TaxID=3155161 RepID=UPI0033FEBEAF
MSSSANRAVERVINTMCDKLSEPLTVDDLAREARFSKFHFTRLFRRVTGVSPGQFLGALRLHEAKRLLSTTEMNVTHIGLLVGYRSIGTFSTRFARIVGLSPATYRRRVRRDSTRRDGSAGAPPSGIRANIHLPPGVVPAGPIFLALFADAVPRCRPVRSTILTRPGPCYLDEVPPGPWYLLCHVVPGGILRTRPRGVLQATAGPVEAGTADPVELRLVPVTLESAMLERLLACRKAVLHRVVAEVAAA